MKVLITGLFEPAAVLAIRRLGELGHTVVAAEGHRLAYAAYSKHVSRRIRVPNMRHHPEEYAQAILHELESGKYDAYFPSYEEIILLSRFRDRVLAATKTAMADTRTLLALHDKAQLDRLARELGIDTPQTYSPGSLAEAKELIATVPLPVVIKMRQGSAAAGLRRVTTREDLERQYADVVETNQLPESDLAPDPGDDRRADDVHAPPLRPRQRTRRGHVPGHSHDAADGRDDGLPREPTGPRLSRRRGEDRSPPRLPRVLRLRLHHPDRNGDAPSSSTATAASRRASRWPTTADATWSRRGFAW